MNHAYLTKSAIKEALQTHAITKKEAQHLQKCLECQEKIKKVMTHH